MIRALCLVAILAAQGAGRGTPVAAPLIVVATSKGMFSFETYPSEAPKTVAHIVALVRQGFYDGQRFHRVVPGFVVQWGDPQTRDVGKEADWGRGVEASSGSPVGVPEISKTRTHAKGAVGIAHPGDPTRADSQIYVTLASRPDLDGKYTVFGRLRSGADVVERIERGDLILKMSVQE